MNILMPILRHLMQWIRYKSDITQDSGNMETCNIMNITARLDNDTACINTNVSNDSNQTVEDMSYKIVVAVLTSLLAFVILIGNGLIIVSVTLVRKLRQPANYLIVSLALADFLVAFVVLPLTIVYDILGEWVFGPTICNIHVSFDVICCATSILNLCMISIDRYLMITRPMTYPKQRTAKLMAFMIGSAWILSCLFTFPALFGFTKNVTDDPEWMTIGPSSRFRQDSLNYTFGCPNLSSIKTGNSETYWSKCDSTSTMWQFAIDMEREYFTTSLRFESVNKSNLYVQVQTISKDILKIENTNYSMFPMKAVTLLGSPTRYIRIFANESSLENFTDATFGVFGELIHGKTCLISQDVWFTIYSTVGSFYIPLAVMLCMYYKIYEEASRFKARHRARSKSLSEQPHSLLSLPLHRKDGICMNDLASSSSDLQDLGPGCEQVPMLHERSNLDTNYVELPEKQDNATDSTEILETNQIPKTLSDVSEDAFKSSLDFDESFEKTTKPTFVSKNQVNGLENGHTCNHNNITLNDRTSSLIIPFEINGNATQDDKSYSISRSASWCKTLHYSSASVLQIETATMLDTRLKNKLQNTNRESPAISVVPNTPKAIRSSNKISEIFGYKRKISRSGSLLSSVSKPKRTNRRPSSSSSRDRLRNAKAIRTLGIIVLVFTFCWLPFFILTFIRPFVCENPESQDCFPLWLVRLVLWLGYLNSALNPIIYVGFSPDLRETIRFLIFCKCANVDRRLAQIELRQAIEDEQRESLAPLSQAASLKKNAPRI